MDTRDDDDIYADVEFEGTDQVHQIFGNPPVLSKKQLVNVTFRNAKMSRARFVEAKLNNVTFDNCELDEVDFSSVDGNRITFRRKK